MANLEMTDEARNALETLLDVYGDLEREQEALLKPLPEMLPDRKAFHDLLHTTGLYLIALNDLQEDLGF